MDSNNTNDEFYIGYLPTAPAGLGKMMRKVSILLLVTASVAAAILVMNQKPFYPSVYEFGNTRTYEGILCERPYPILLVARPGQTGESPVYSQYLLVGDGKFGAATVAKGLDGKRVRLNGALIYRDDQTMIKITDGTITPLSDEAVSLQNGKNLGTFQLSGEIVDSQCYLGVMNPGESKPHKECAVRCISGGVPPVFVVKDFAGTANYFLLVSAEGKTINQEVLPFVADPIRIEGQVIQYENVLVLQADSKNFKRLN
jgi:hypothetical protein